MAERQRRTSLPSPVMKKRTLSDTVTDFLSPDAGKSPLHSTTTPDITRLHDTSTMTGGFSDTTMDRPDTPHDSTGFPHTATDVHDGATAGVHDAKATDTHDAATRLYGATTGFHDTVHDTIITVPSSPSDKTGTGDDATSMSLSDNFSMEDLQMMQQHHHQQVHRRLHSPDATMDTHRRVSSDIFSLSTENSFAATRDKAFQPLRPQVKTIIVQGKDRRRVSNHELPSEKQNPHIILVEPELSTTGSTERKESSGHIPIRREPLESFLAPTASRERARSYPYEDTETTGITPAMTPAATPASLTPQMSSIKEEELNAAGFKKSVAALKLKARKWMKKSAVGETVSWYCFLALSEPPPASTPFPLCTIDYIITSLYSQTRRKLPCNSKGGHSLSIQEVPWTTGPTDAVCRGSSGDEQGKVGRRSNSAFLRMRKAGHYCRHHFNTKETPSYTIASDILSSYIAS